ncbi:hypothetical protein GCM10029992_52270 [Glycomyces albus]
MRNHRLNRLVTDLELESDFDGLAWEGWSVDRTGALFDALQFRTLGERLNTALGERAVGQVAVPENQAADLLAERLEPGGLAAWLDTVAGDVAIAYTGSFESGAGSFDSIALAEGDRALWFDPAGLGAEDDQVWARWLSDPEHGKVVNDAKSFLWGADAAGWPEPAGLRVDTVIAAYLLKPEQRSYALGDLAMQYLGRELEATEKSADDGALVGLDEAMAGAEGRFEADCAAAAIIGELARTETEKLTERRQQRLAEELEYPIVPVLARMEVTGIAADEGTSPTSRPASPPRPRTLPTRPTRSWAGSSTSAPPSSSRRSSSTS